MRPIVLARFLAAAAIVWAVLWGFSRRLLNWGTRRVRGVEIRDLEDATTTDASGAVRSIQAANLLVPHDALAEMWTPEYLERVGRTYWRFLSRVTLGLVRVVYTERERYIVLVARPLKLITFQAPEYEMDSHRGVVRWRIERGLLVARRGRGGCGYLQIDMSRHELPDPDRDRLHVEVEVANFYPSIAKRLGRWVYNETQSRVHVIVTHAFLRSLAKRDLEQSRVGRYAGVDAVPGPPPDVAPAAEPASSRSAASRSMKAT